MDDSGYPYFRNPPYGNMGIWITNGIYIGWDVPSSNMPAWEIPKLLLSGDFEWEKHRIKRLVSIVTCFHFQREKNTRKKQVCFMFYE